MKGIIKNIESSTKTITKGERKGQRFSQIIITVDVAINDKGDVKTLKATMSTEYAVKYFTYCGYKSKDLFGKECECTLAKRQFQDEDGVLKTYSYIKFLNMIDKQGKSIILEKEASEQLPF